MKRLILMACIALVSSAALNAQTVNATTVNVSSKIKLKSNIVTDFQLDTNFVSNSKIPTSLAIKKYIDGHSNSSSTQNLQIVTDAGNLTTNPINIGYMGGFFADNYLGLTQSSILFAGPNISSKIIPSAGTSLVAIPQTQGFQQTLAVSVNNEFADANGNINLATGGYTPTVEIEDTTEVPNTLSLQSIAWSPKLKIFLGVKQQCNSSTLYIYTSTDGVNWISNIANNFILNWQCKISWNNDLKKFIAVGSSSNLACQYNSQIKAGFQMSSDGINWEIHPPSLPRGSYVFVSEYCYSKELNILLATSNVNEIYKSTDKGLTFTLASNSTGMQFYNVYWFKELNKFIAYDENNTTLKYSTDGDNWTIGNSGVSGIYFSYFSDNFFYDKNVSKIVSLTTLGVGQFISSSDGINWETTGEVNPNAYRLYSYNKYLGKYLYYSNNTSTSFLGTTPLNSTALCYSPELNIYLGISADYSKIIVSKMTKY